MLWLARPPYLRWLAVAGALMLSMWLELRPEETVDHPFALEEIRPGTVVTADDVEWRTVPEGLLHPVSLPWSASRLVAAGEPLPAATAAGTVAPEGWWALSLPSPVEAQPGEEVRIVVGSPPRSVVAGIVVGASNDDGYGAPGALVAIPEETVTEVAEAAAAGEVTIVVRAGR